MKKIDQLVVSPDRTNKVVAESLSKEKNHLDHTSSSKDHIDVINQLFAEFELAYHNQYRKAYPDEGALNLAKKYWLNNLSSFSPNLILAAARYLVQNQAFLPTVANVIDACKSGVGLFGLPVSHDAYIEACAKGSPKAAQEWSHPAVYLAGKATGWFELANQSEAQVFPLFDYHYAQLVQRVIHGEELTINSPKPLPEHIDTPLSNEENQSRLQELKATLKL